MANHYIRRDATGNNSGIDWTNAYTQLPSSLIRGDTYYVADGSYANYDFDDANDGTLVITIKKATIADHGTDIGWSDAYGDGQAIWSGYNTWQFYNSGYYNIDGVTGGGPGSWDTNFGFQIYTTHHAIDFQSGTSTNISLDHVDISGDGRAQPREAPGYDRDLIYVVYGSAPNFKISHSYLHDVNREMILSFPSPFNVFTLEYSKLARNGFLEHASAWSPGTDDNVIVRYNIFEDIMGTGQIGLVNGNGNATNWQIYGNVFYWTQNYLDGMENSGAIVVKYTDPTYITAVNWQIYNNIFVGIHGYSAAIEIPSQSGVTSYNNMWVQNHVNSIYESGTHDYAWYYNNTGYDYPEQDTNNPTSEHDVVGTSDPFDDWVNGTFLLIYEVPGLILNSPFNFDPLGLMRGTDGVWDRGAYEYVSTQDCPTPIVTFNLNI